MGFALEFLCFGEGKHDLDKDDNSQMAQLMQPNSSSFIVLR